jgi:hypothetical protein
MEILAVILIIAGALIFALSIQRMIKREIPEQCNDVEAGKRTEPFEPSVECWNCPSCSQWNRVDQPYFHLDKHLCQNCYEPKPERVEFGSIKLSVYWSQAKFAQEHFRREAEKAKQKPWIDPSIGKGKTHTLDFDAPEKKLPDDLRDKISRN